MAVAQKTGIPKWVALVTGNMGIKTCGLPFCLILSHTHIFDLPRRHVSQGIPMDARRRRAQKPEARVERRRPRAELKRILTGALQGLEF